MCPSIISKCTYGICSKTFSFFNYLTCALAKPIEKKRRQYPYMCSVILASHVLNDNISFAPIVDHYHLFILRFFFEIDKIVCFLLFLHGLKIMHVSLEKEKKHV